ncbi:hypothetical protein C8R43DRAFT_942543 [Mycena crocata]|nr:hypothetical protein C8R43DRAFT_942543 [Mycena crocata]
MCTVDDVALEERWFMHLLGCESERYKETALRGIRAGFSPWLLQRCRRQLIIADRRPNVQSPGLVHMTHRRRKSKRQFRVKTAEDPERTVRRSQTVEASSVFLEVFIWDGSKGTEEPAQVPLQPRDDSVGVDVCREEGGRICRTTGRVANITRTDGSGKPVSLKPKPSTCGRSCTKIRNLIDEQGMPSLHSGGDSTTIKIGKEEMMIEFVQREWEDNDPVLKQAMGFRRTESPKNNPEQHFRL